MRIALYCRVSKNDESQDPQNQLIPLRDYAKALGGDIVGEYVDLASGGNGDRKEFLRMFEDAQVHRFDLLLVWALDRLSREGISNTLGYLERLKRNGVALKSLQNHGLTPVMTVWTVAPGYIQLVAQQERKRIVERTRAGLLRARREGKKLGRPKGAKDGKARRKSGYFLRYKNDNLTV